MTDRKPELPKLDEETLEMMQACGYDELDRTHIALEGRESQLLSALTKIAAMEELLRSDRIDGLHLHCVTDFETDTGRHIDTRCVRCKRVDALLEGK